MNSKDKYYLKALLLASLSTIGMPVSQPVAASMPIVRKEYEGSDLSSEIISKELSSGILQSHPSFGEVLGHKSHSSHVSHVSHQSHVSSGYTGYGGGGGGSSNKTNESLAVVGGVVGSVALTYLIYHLITKHNKHVISRKAEINRPREYASRDLSSGLYGDDVDRMTELLIENDVLNWTDRTYSHKRAHYKYDRRVKRSVKQIQARMGKKRTGKASREFLMNLQDWKRIRSKVVDIPPTDSLNLTDDRKTLWAVAILLVEKGYLKSYDVDNIMSEHEKSRILEAYYEFLRSKKIPETPLVDEERLRLLISLPDMQK